MIALTVLEVILQAALLGVTLRLLLYPALDVDVVAKAEGKGRSVTPKWSAKRVIDSASHRWISVGGTLVKVEEVSDGLVDVVGAGVP